MSLLNVENIRKSYGKTEVLKDISFSLKKGEVLAIIGSSGSGKTTLLRCLNFLETPGNGKISVNDKVLFDSNDSSAKSDSEIRKRRLHFGLVFQSFNLFPQYTVIENIMLAPKLAAKEQIKQTGEYMGAKSYKEAHEIIKSNAKSLLERVGLSEKSESYPCNLSGGRQTRTTTERVEGAPAQFILHAVLRSKGVFRASYCVKQHGRCRSASIREDGRQPGHVFDRGLSSQHDPARQRFQAHRSQSCRAS